MRTTDEQFNEREQWLRGPPSTVDARALQRRRNRRGAAEARRRLARIRDTAR